MLKKIALIAASVIVSVALFADTLPTGPANGANIGAADQHNTGPKLSANSFFRGSKSSANSSPSMGKSALQDAEGVVQIRTSDDPGPQQQFGSGNTNNQSNDVTTDSDGKFGQPMIQPGFVDTPGTANNPEMVNGEFPADHF